MELTERPPRPWLRTAALAAALLGMAALLLPAALAGCGEATGAAGSAAGLASPVLHWWQLAPLFALAEVFVVHVEVDRDAHTFSLSEVPFVLALLFTSPVELIAARLIGEAVVLVVHERQAAAKLGFNLSLFTAESCLALAVFHALGASRGPVDAASWVAALTAVCAAAVLGVVAVWTVIRLHGGRTDPRPLFVVAGVTGVGNASVAGITAILLSGQAWALVPLLVVTVVLVVAYRGYTRLSKRYAGLDVLYQFTRITSTAMRPEQAIACVLDEARRLLRAEYAMILLTTVPDGAPAVTVSSPTERAAVDLPAALRRRVLDQRETVVVPRTTRDPQLRALLGTAGVLDLLAAPLVSGGAVLGALLVADRLGGVSTFDGDDVRLFTTLANQAGVTLDNGRLIERLHDQVRAREHEALHDALTGLPNRLHFARTLEGTLAASNSGSDAPRCAVLIMDLDQFKEVNDTLGHHVGDALLQAVSRRLLSAIAGRGLVARLGGDEFAVLIPDLTAPGDAAAIAHRLHAHVTAPIRLADVLLEVGASIGIAIHPDHGDTVAILLQRADVAMYAAKRTRDRVTSFDGSAQDSSLTRLRLAGELRRALEQRQLAVRYQPITRVTSEAGITAEALVRWQHPELGELAPEVFIPVAERAGLIGQLTEYVLGDALAQCRNWQDDGLDVRVAVNLSVQVLLDVEWPAKVLAALRRHRVGPDRLVLEITETGIMSDPPHMIAMLNELTRAGVTFSIDDFGTGYSSLSYLQQLPIREIKIDKSFVLPLTADPSAASIVRAVVDLARNLDLDIIAEGVEDQQTFDRLSGMHCDRMQGFFLSRPLPARELTTWLRERRAQCTAHPPPVPTPAPRPRSSLTSARPGRTDSHTGNGGLR